MMVWFGFIIFWIATSNSIGAPGLFVLFGFLMLGIGAYATFGSYFRKKYIMKRTIYVITNKRVLLIKHKNIEIIESKDKSPLTITYHNDGTGSIIFENTRKVHYHSTNHHVPHYSFKSIENIENVDLVQNLINELE